MSEYKLNQLQEDEYVNPRGIPISWTSTGEIYSYHYDIKWNFIGTEATAVGKQAIVSFAMTDIRYRKVIQNTLYEISIFYNNKNYIFPTVSQLTAWKMGYQHIADILETANWCLLDDEYQFKLFKRALKQREFGRRTIEVIVTSLHKLFDSKIINRFIDYKELAGLTLDKQTQQHIAIPIFMYKKVLEKSIIIVEKYHPYRFDIARIMEDVYDLYTRIQDGLNVAEGMHGAREILVMTDNALCSRTTRAIKRITHCIPDFNADLTGGSLIEIQSACMIIVLAFSGVRVGEAISFNTNSYSVKMTENGKEIAILRGETTKGHSGKPCNVTWQSHPIVKDALELAEIMTKPMRELYRKKIESKLNSGNYNNDQYQKALDDVSSAFIPCKYSRQGSKYVASNMARRIESLMKQYNLVATQKDVEEFDLLNPSRFGQLKVNGFLPKLTPHDFRRTFAVFFRRYNFGSAAGIKFQYKHQNINMSDYYMNNAHLMHMHDVLLDNDLLALMQEERVNLCVDIYDEIYNASEHLSGLAGETIAKEKFEKLQTGQHVFMDRSEIERLVRHGSLSVIQLPTGGYCTNSDCERVCGIGIFDAEKNVCMHLVNTDKSAKQMAQQRKRLIDMFRGFNTGESFKNNILFGIKQKIKQIEIILNQHELTYEPFSDIVKGVTNV